MIPLGQVPGMWREELWHPMVVHFPIALLLFFLRIACALAFAVGTLLTGYIGHLGAKLVYQQGAAVYQPSEDCSEFIE